jgi:hypothetical protein
VWSINPSYVTDGRLQNFTRTNTLPVFRTESQDRMLASAQNFAAGFFGLPYAEQYQQLVTIEDPGVRLYFLLLHSVPPS